MHAPSLSTSSSLLRRVQQRDAGAWERLTQLYGPLVYHWCRRYGLGPADAADVFQEVFAAVAQHVTRFERGENGTFRGWLWTIARNKIHDHFRRQGNKPQAAGGSAAQQQLANLPEQLPDDSTDDAAPGRQAALFHRGLELVRAEFEEPTWQAFWQVVVEERPTAEVAEELGVTANAVRQYKSRVLRRLRQELGDLLE